MKIGLSGSPAHILTNNRILNKKDCIKEVLKSNIKHDAVLLSATAVAGAAAMTVSSFSKKTADFVPKIQKNAQKLIRNFKFKDKSIMAKIQKSSLYKSFNMMSIPAKAGIFGAAAAFAVLAPISMINRFSENAKIEGNYEISSDSKKFILPKHLRKKISISDAIDVDGKVESLKRVHKQNSEIATAIAYAPIMAFSSFVAGLLDKQNKSDNK